MDLVVRADQAARVVLLDPVVPLVLAVRVDPLVPEVPPAHLGPEVRQDLLDLSVQVAAHRR